MARVMTRAIEPTEHFPINLGNPQELSVLDLARLIQSLTGHRAGIESRPLPEDDPNQRCPDISGHANCSAGSREWSWKKACA